MTGKYTILFFVYSLLGYNTLCMTVPKKSETTVALKYDGVAVSIELTSGSFSLLDGQIHLDGFSGLICFHPKPVIVNLLESDDDEDGGEDTDDDNEDGGEDALGVDTFGGSNK
jgi:hypothetical protein